MQPAWGLVDIKGRSGQQIVVRLEAENDEIVDKSALFVEHTAVETASGVRLDIR
jgi:hypothetical protein